MQANNPKIRKTDVSFGYSSCAREGFHLVIQGKTRMTDRIQESLWGKEIELGVRFHWMMAFISGVHRKKTERLGARKIAKNEVHDWYVGVPGSISSTTWSHKHCLHLPPPHKNKKKHGDSKGVKCSWRVVFITMSSHFSTSG